MKSSAKKVELAPYDDLFSTEESRQDAKLEKVREIPLSELHPFKNHPFKVKDDAVEGPTPITVRYDDDDLFNYDFEPVLFNTVNAETEVRKCLPGDLNNDGKINIRDLGLLQQHLNGWNVTFEESAADLNGDGKLNIRDLGLLQQYLNGWDIEFK